jgi:fatty-acyl-CoA synthase
VIDVAHPSTDRGQARENAPTTVIDALTLQAERRGDRAAFTVHDPEGRATTLSYAELLSRARRVAVGLKERGLRQGDRLLICLPTCPELLTTIFGAMLVGAACVPVYPPQASQGLRRWKEQVLAIARIAQPRGAVVAIRAHLHMAAVLEQAGEDLFTAVASQLEARGEEQALTIDPARDLAFVQFTSGTTTAPRGVSVTHAALMANIGALLSVMPLSDADISVSWLPPYHDMGLVGHIFVPVCSAVHQYLMPPATLVRRPARWLQLITRVRATQTTAPNFAFSMCVRRVTRAELGALDLGCLRWVLNGAEMVQAGTVRAFCDTFGTRGFPHQAFRPVYGLAETTLTATFGPDGGALIEHVDRQRLAASREARRIAEGAASQPFVCVGRPLPGHELQIVRDDGMVAVPRQLGEIRLRGPSVMRGYFNNPQATREALRDGWLTTGDLGYLDEERRLYVTGRRKELIIKGGRNYPPEDFEAACLETTGLRPGRAVAFGLPNVRTGTEDIVIVAEVRDEASTRDPVLLQRVVRAVSDRTGLRPDRVELVEPGTLPRTTSGKLQRTKIKAAYQAGRALRMAPPTIVDAVREGIRSVVDLASTRIGRLLGWR